MSNKENKNKTLLSKKYRLPISVNQRAYKGYPLINASYIDEVNGKEIVRFIDQTTENGGTVTPFNIQCRCMAAPAVRTIITKGDVTTVVFADGDRVVLKRHENDKYDLVTTVGWALLQKVFGRNVVRQIHTAIDHRHVDADKIHEAKNSADKANC